mgnify:FL=1
MANYYNSCWIKPKELISYVLKIPSNDLSLENKNLGENLREIVEIYMKKLCIARALSNIEAKFCIL